MISPPAGDDARDNGRSEITPFPSKPDRYENAYKTIDRSTLLAGFSEPKA
jgi:hypothetical protein